MSNLELLDRAANAAACQSLFIASGSLVSTGVVSIVGAGVGFIPLTAGMAGLLAANYLCNDMPLGDGNKVPSADGCTKIKDGVGQLQVAGTASDGEFYDAWDSNLWPHNDKVTEITEAFYEPWAGEWRTILRYMTTEGPQERMQLGIDTEEKAAASKARIRPTTGTCDGTSSDPVDPPPDIYEPISYTDNITNCNYNVTFQGFAQPVPNGPAQFVYLVEGATQQRAGGGRMGGCNFPPTIYMPGGNGGGGGGGGGVYLPVPDGGPPGPGPDGLPWWAAPLFEALGTVALEKIVDAILDALEPPVPPAEFTLTAPCDKDDDGAPLQRTWNFEAEKAGERVLSHQVAMFEVIQQHLNWKTPTCGNEKTPLEGTWISTRWESDGISPGGTKPLRKLFRYRSKSARTADELQIYWRDFVWEAGDVVVTHKGSWWGNPQVWAASEEEGKRVLRFAAGEAGIDPDQVGEWRVGSSRSPRYGMSGRMRLEEHQGERWVTRRDGPSGLPEL